MRSWWWWCHIIKVWWWRCTNRKIRIWWWVDVRVWWCFWSKDQSMMMMLLLIKRPKWWRRCCWSKGQSAEDVVDWKVKVLKMLLTIEESRCWRCCWSKRSKYWWCWRLKIEDEDYMMLKSFQWFINVSPCWCWWCPLSSLTIVVVDVVVEYPSR